MGYKMTQMISSKYFRKEDVPQPKVLTIAAVKLEEMPGDAQEEKFVLYFHGEEKGMVLGTGIIQLLFSTFCAHGQDDTDMWLGKQVKLYVDPSVQMKGKTVGGLRLRMPTVSTVQTATPTATHPQQPPPAAPVAASQPKFDGPAFDDDIPF